MNSSYNEVLHLSRMAWRFQRLQLVLEYSQHNQHIHPLSIPVNLYEIAKVFCPKQQHKRFPFFDSWDEFYNSDECMASLHEEVYREPQWLIDCNKPDSAEKDVKAEYMRRCTDLVNAMSAQLRSKEVAAKDAAGCEVCLDDRLATLESRMDARLKSFQDAVEKRLKLKPLPPVLGRRPA